MGNWQERERKIDQEKIQREDNRRSFRQSEINTILEGFSVRTILDEIRTDVWGEGEIREIIKEDRNGFSYKEGLELVTRVPTVLVIKSPEYGTVYHSGGYSDGVSWGEYTTHGVTGYKYKVAIGDIEVSLRITVGKSTDWVYDHSEGFISVSVPKTTRVILIEDIPFLKNDESVELKGKNWDDRSEVWFPLFAEENVRYKHYIEDQRSYIKVLYSPISGEVFSAENLEEELVRRVESRRKTQNLPFQMRERSNKFIAKVPYEKTDRTIDVMEYFHKSIESRRRATNAYSEYEFPPRAK